MNTVRGMKMGGNSHWKPSQAGLIISTHVVVMLQHYLLDVKGYAPFPSNRTLGRRLQGLSFLPEVFTEVFDVLKT